MPTTSSPTSTRPSLPPRPRGPRLSRGSALPVFLADPSRGPSEPGTLAIGLLNILSDAALGSAERQVGDLLSAAAGERQVALHLFTLPSIPRGAAAAKHIARAYGDLAALRDASLHGLFVTGAEPRAADLRDEAFWPELTALIDWTVSARCPTLWSCLAAHAAVLHLDGVGRRRLPAKLSGTFRVQRRLSGGLLADLPDEVVTTHSRWNEISARDLARAGYSILTGATEVGVDTFSKLIDATPFVFLQGHPEYDGGALAREYRRDVLRYLSRHDARYPDLPSNYFTSDMRERLLRFRDLCREKREAASFATFPPLPLTTALGQNTGAFGVTLVRNWLNQITPMRQPAHGGDNIRGLSWSPGQNSSVQRQCPAA